MFWLPTPPCGAALTSVTSIQHWERDSSLPTPASPLKNPARLTLHGSPVIDNTVYPLGSIPVTWNNSWKIVAGNRRGLPGTEENNNQLTEADKYKAEPTLSLDNATSTKARKVWECHAIRLNAD